MSDMDDVQIQKIEFPDEKGMFSIQARSPAFAALASEFVRIFKEDKGINGISGLTGPNPVTQNGTHAP